MQILFISGIHLLLCHSSDRALVFIKGSKQPGRSACCRLPSLPQKTHSTGAPYRLLLVSPAVTHTLHKGGQGSWNRGSVHPALTEVPEAEGPTFPSSEAMLPIFPGSPSPRLQKPGRPTTNHIHNLSELSSQQVCLLNTIVALF